MPGRPLKVGLLLPHWSGALDAASPRWPEIAGLARRAEEAGFDSLWVADTILVQPDGGRSMGFWECWTLLAALAGVTERVELGSLVAGAFRNPVLLANEANTVDELSNGRVVLGIGAGDVGQHGHVGLDVARRFSRLEEVLMITGGLLRDGRAALEGHHHRVRDVELPLRGPRAGGPPIMLGTYPQPGPRMRRLAAQHADGWNAWCAFEGSSVELVGAARAGLDEACEAADRDPASLWRSVAVGVSLRGRAVLFGPWNITRAAISGSPAEIAETLHAYAGAGIAHVQAYLGHEPDVDAFGPVLELLDG